MMRINSGSILKWLKRMVITFVAAFLFFLLLNLLFPLHDRVEYSTIVLDNKGEVMHAYLTSDEKWRMKTTLEEISPLLRKTIIGKEDKYFYSHPGVNFLAVGRAFVNNLLQLKRTSGASTITMQVARALEPKRRTYFNKVVEMFRAFQLEWKYSKDEILQLYVNLVPYGSNLEGVKSASTLYFKKNPDHLSLAEITALSIIPNRPSTLVIGKNNDLIVQERNKWLKRFASENLFTEKEIQDALTEPLLATRGIVPKLAPHISYKLKKNGGDIIWSTIDLNKQSTVEKLTSDYVRSLTLKNIHNAAVVVVDNKTMNVISYVGSGNFNDTIDAGQVNGAAAIRQPGSTLKPLLYGLCIDKGLLTPKSIITDVAISYEGYAPENYDKQFNGYVTMEYALEHSLNIPAVKSLRSLGLDQMIQQLSLSGFNQIKKDQKKLGLSLILGGCGASLEELAGNYATYANEGVYQPLQWLKTDSIGARNRKKTRILSPAANFMVTETLSKINRPDFPLNWQSTEKMPKIAWKTGTSYGRRDAWSIGYNKNYTVAVWVGNFSGVGVAELSGATIATPLLFKIFNSIDYDSDELWFQLPEDCDTRQVCSETGMLPSEHCDHTVSDYFIPLVSSTKKCDNMEEILLSADEKFSYCKICAPASGYKKKWMKKVSPDMQQYFQENRVAYEQIPTHNPSCEKLFKEGAPIITFPRSGTEYLISKKNPEPIQLTCNVSNDVTKVYWYINNQFFKTAEAHSKQFFVPDEGPVKISCTDDKGRNKDIWITVKRVEG